MKARNRNLQIIIVTLSVLISLSFYGCASFVSNIPPEPIELSNNLYEKIGTVDAEMSNWNWFFRSSAEKRTEQLEQKLLKEAETKFGTDIILKTELTEGNWSPASLLMLFSTIGFVEDAYMQASVWRLKPEPVPEMRPVNYGIRYVVIPEENYTDEKGFMLVEYKTREELEEELLNAFNNGEFNEISLERRQYRLPDTGKIFITLGREDIRNAISRWFSFYCTYNEKTIFKTRGIEDIPYVYGTDKLWWNDMSYNVGPEWDEELKLMINDSYQNRDFYFRIVKEIYEIPAE